MFELTIDGTRIRSEKFVKPLIAELKYVAQSDGFRSALIQNVSDDSGPQYNFRVEYKGGAVFTMAGLSFSEVLGELESRLHTNVGVDAVARWEIRPVPGTERS